MNQLHYSVSDTSQELLWRKTWAICRLQRSSECKQRQMAWCRYETIRIRKAILQRKRHL